MKNPLLKKANGFDTPAGERKKHYDGYYPEAVGGAWNPQTDNDSLRGELSDQLGGYAAGTRGSKKTRDYINGLYRGTQEPPAEPEGKKPQTGKWLNASAKNKIATGEMSRSDVTRENYPIYFAIADAVGGTVEPFDVYQGPYIDTDQGRLFLTYDGGGGAVVWNESTREESNAFLEGDENGAVDAALSILPKKPTPKKRTPTKTKNPRLKQLDAISQKWYNRPFVELDVDMRKEVEEELDNNAPPPKDKKIRKVPQFSEADRISLHGLGVKGSMKAAWDKAIKLGMLKFESNRYAFTKSANTNLRTELKATVAQVNSSLNRRHIPKSGAAHEAAVRVIASIHSKQTAKLDKIEKMAMSLFQKEAGAWYWDTGDKEWSLKDPSGAEIGKVIMGPMGSATAIVDGQKKKFLSAIKAVEWVEKTTNVGERRGQPPASTGVPTENLPPIPQEQLHDAVRPDFESKFLQKPQTAAAKPKCPHCGSSDYNLMPTDFETAKCNDCGKNWDHGIVRGINDPKTSGIKSDADFREFIEKGKEKTAFFSPEDAEQFRKDNDGSNLVMPDALDPIGQDWPRQESEDDTKWEPVFDKGAAQKTAATYEVAKRDGGWYILGLKSQEFPNEGDALDEEGMATRPDSFIVPGMHHALNSPESLTEGIYVALYDEFQTNKYLNQGDIFDTPVGQFICEGIHVLPYDDKAKANVQAVNDGYKCVHCGCDKGKHEDGGYGSCRLHPECREYANRKTAAWAPPVPENAPPAMIEQLPAQVKPAFDPAKPIVLDSAKGDVKPALEVPLPEIREPKVYVNNEKGDYKEVK